MNQEQLDRLSIEEKKGLLKKVRSSTHRNLASPIEIPRYPRDTPIPTSVIQQEIWFYENIVEDSNAYNIAISLEIQGNLNHVALVQAFRIVIARYEILRTSFYTIEGIPYQRVVDQMDFKLNVIKLGGLSLEKETETIWNILFQFAKRSFSLDTPPLFRVVCLEVNPSRSILAFVIHHLLCDNWSLTLLFQEILTLFNQISRGQSIQFSMPPYQYGDYCFWEKEMLLSRETQEKIESFKKRLSQIDLHLKLPYDFPRDFSQRATAKSRQFVLDRQTNQKVVRLCHALQITPYIFFFAIYHILIQKYTCQSNIVIGTSFLSRPTDDEKGILGPFINVALIGSTLSPEMTFEAVIRQLKETILEMHSYRFIPLKKMVKSVNTFRRKELSLSQLFYGFLNFELSRVPGSTDENLSVKLLNQSNELRVYNAAKFELDLTMWKDAADMGGSLEYMSNVFQEETIGLLVEHFMQLCEAMADRPDHFIGDIHLKDPLDKVGQISEAEVPFAFL